MNTTNTTQHESLMTMAVNANKDTVNITEVKSGLQSDAFCVVCNSTLIAKKGEIKAHHFAHTNGTECKYWRETFIHLAVKKYLSETKCIRLPNYFIEDKVIQSKVDFYFTECIVETRLGSIVPDICLIADNGAKLIVEVAVTHFCDSVKIEKIKELNTSCIELDFSKFNSGDGSMYEWEIKKYIEVGLYSKWIFHRKLNPLQDAIAKTKQDIRETKHIIENKQEEILKIKQRKYSHMHTKIISVNYLKPNFSLYGEDVNFDERILNLSQCQDIDRYDFDLLIANKHNCPLRKSSCKGCKYMASAENGVNQNRTYVSCAYGTAQRYFEFLQDNEEKIKELSFSDETYNERLIALSRNLSVYWERAYEIGERAYDCSLSQ